MHFARITNHLRCERPVWHASPCGSIAKAEQANDGNRIFRKFTYLPLDDFLTGFPGTLLIFAPHLPRLPRYVWHELILIGKNPISLKIEPFCRENNRDGAFKTTMFFPTLLSMMIEKPKYWIFIITAMFSRSLLLLSLSCYKASIYSATKLFVLWPWRIIFQQVQE